MTEHDQERQLRESVEHIAERAAEKAAEATAIRVLTLLGIDAANPIQTQAQFQALRKVSKLIEDEEVVEDLAFARRLRKATDAATKVTWTTIVKALVTLAIGIFAIGTKDWWLTHIGLR